jgi:cytochrome c2
MTSRRIVGLTLMGAVVSGALFAAGVFAGRPDLASRDGVGRILARLGIGVPDRVVSGSSTRVIDSALLPLSIEAYAYTLGAPARSRGGGGIAGAGDEVIGVDRLGHFFLFSAAREFASLDISIETNIDDLRRMPIDMVELQQRGIDTADLIRRGLNPEAPHEFNLRSFRFTDIELSERDGGLDVLVGYAYWYPERQCKTLRLSRAHVPSLAALADGLQPDWDEIFETTPCIEFSYRAASGFQSPNNGGRIAFLDADRVLFSVGDHHMDGFNSEIAASQVDSVSYGKLYEINLRTLEPTLFAKGLRNAQGVFVDADGTVWETEHGPQGGDELNRIQRGGNYGWPYVTHGTQYRDYQWPLNPTPGRHNAFEPPLYSWVPSIGVSSILRVYDFADAWDGDLLAGSLRAGSLFRVTLVNDRVTVVEPIPVGDRVRDMLQAGDGAIIVWTDSQRILRLSPQVGAVGGPIPFAESLEAGVLDAVSGCATCHSLSRGEGSLAAPSLWGVYGRRIGGAPYTGYSAALSGRRDRWNAESLEGYIRDPDAFAPGSTMPSPEVGGDAEVAGIITYLRRLR